MQSKDRTSQTIALIALIVGVFALTIGFAAFNTTLRITSAADVTPGQQTLDVEFSTSQNSASGTSTVSATPGGTESGATGDTADLTATTISNINAHFTKPGQTVTYSFYVFNNSAYTAYLTGITFADVTGGTTGQKIKCEAATGENAATQGISDACNDITITVTVDSYSATETKTGSQITPTKSITAGVGKTVTVVIEYLAGTGHGHIADGNFNVSFGDITLDYSSVPAGS